MVMLYVIYISGAQFFKCICQLSCLLHEIAVAEINIIDIVCQVQSMFKFLAAKPIFDAVLVFHVMLR